MISRVTVRDSDPVPVDQPELRVTKALDANDEPVVRLWTRNGPYSATANLNPAAHAEFIEALTAAAGEAWG